MDTQKYDAIYSRQSVDRLDSISTESQVEYCLYEVRGGAYKTFIDKGYSGKNTERPEFQKMMEEIRNGRVKRVIAYKLDRISRSVLDFMNLFTEFQQYGVEFVSCTEKFDTSTPMGRAMLKIIVVFAELERETIQQRVCDAYVSRSRKGFYMGGRIPFGFKLEPFDLDGRKTSRYVPEPYEAGIVKIIFAEYSKPQVSSGDVVQYLYENKIYNPRRVDGTFDRSRITDIIRNPIYVKADLTVYKFFKDNGAVMHNDISDFVGVYGCYFYKDTSGNKNKRLNIEGSHIVLAPHYGIIDSDIWMKARLKCSNNQQVAKPIKGGSTWLIGKIKCGKCGYALNAKKSKDGTKKWFCCTHKYQTGKCEGVHGILVDEFETMILSEMKTRLKQLGSTLSSSKSSLPNPRIRELELKIEYNSQVIENLVDKVSEFDGVSLTYLQNRIEKVDSETNAYRQELSDIQAKADKTNKETQQLKNYMDHWEELSFDDKRAVVDNLISVIKATENSCEIQWRI